MEATTPCEPGGWQATSQASVDRFRIPKAVSGLRPLLGRGDQTGAHRLEDCLRPTLDVELGEDAADMGLYGLLADRETPRDLLVRLPLCQQAQDVGFPVGQRLRRVRRPDLAHQSGRRLRP